jgi:polyhydroxyalkanoate synthesis regulator phasin
VEIVLEAQRGYVQLATGLTEVTVAKAREAAAALLAQGLDLTQVAAVPGADKAAGAATAAATQVQGLADDLLETSKANREMLTGLIRTEVDRTAGRMGFVREEELAAVRRHVSRLETQLADLRTHVGATAPAEQQAAAQPAEAEPAAEASKPRKKKVVVADAPAADAGDAADADDAAGESGDGA